MKQQYEDEKVILVRLVLFLFAVVIGLILIWILVKPYYRVWSQEMRGKAALAEAKQSKMIQTEQARAELESAQLRAQAVKIMGQAAKDYPEYREQEFIGAFGEALREGIISQIIYVPTESNLPILEAGKRPTAVVAE